MGLSINASLDDLNRNQTPHNHDMNPYVFLGISLVLMAFLLNLVNIVVIRYGKSYLNSTEILQMIKAFLIMVTLLTLCPLDIQSINNTYLKTSIFCRLKGVIEDLIFGAFPMTALAIAITRWRVCSCTGNSNVLVSRFSSCITLMACLMFPISSVIGTLLYTSYEEALNPSKALCSSTEQNWDMQIFVLATIIVTKIVPSVCVVIMYGLIYRLVSLHATLRCSSPTKSNEEGEDDVTPTRKSTVSAKSFKNPQHIFVSLCLIVSVYLLTMLPYVSLSLYKILQSHIYVHQLNSWLVLSKIFVCLLQPLGEGILQEEKRKRLASFIKKLTVTYCKRPSSVDVFKGEEGDPCSNNQANVNNFILPTLFEETAVDDQNNPVISTNHGTNSKIFLATPKNPESMYFHNMPKPNNFSTDLHNLQGGSIESLQNQSAPVQRNSIQRCNSSPDLKSTPKPISQKKLVRSNTFTDRERIKEAMKEIQSVETKFKPNLENPKHLRLQAHKNLQRQMQDSLALPVLGVCNTSLSSQSTNTISRRSSSSSRFLSGAGSCSGRYSNSSKIYSRDSHVSVLSSLSNDTMSDCSFQRFFTLSGRQRRPSVCSRVPSFTSMSSKNSDFFPRHACFMGLDIPENSDCEIDTLSVMSKHF